MAADPIDLATLGKTPIPGDAPAGADASYDPDFESLQHEIDKLSSVSAAGTPPDWDLAVRLGSDILATKAKDIKVAVYLTEALTRTAGLGGMAQGVRVLREMVETYWDTLFPPKKRLRGRFNAIDWWRERASAVIDAYNGDPLPPELVAGLGDDINALDTFLAGQSDEAPMLAPLVQAVSRLPVAEPEPPQAASPQDETPASPEAAQPESAPAPPTAGDTPPPSAVAPTPPPAAPTPPPSPAPAPAAMPQPAAPGGPGVEAARQQVESGLDQLFGAADTLLQSDTTSPVPYRLTRLAAWLTLAAAPPAAAGKTMLPAPNARIKAALEQTLASGNFPAAVTGAESHVREFRFWLDLSRISAEALRGLGPSHAAAQKALETETALFVSRFPGLETLTFADGTPFADDKTRLWLSRLGRKAGGNEGGATDAVAQAVDKARNLAGDNQLVEAVTLLRDTLFAARSGHQRLRCRIGLVEIVLTSGNPENARPLIDQILSDIDVYNIETFDPELAVQALLVARQGLAASDDEQAKALSRGVLARLIGLDPAAGLRVAGLR